MRSSGLTGTRGMCVNAAAAALLALITMGGVAQAQDAQATPAQTTVSTATTTETATAVPATPGDTVVSTQPDPNLPASGVPVADGAIQLSLDEALTTALERNLGLLVERYDRNQFRLRIDESLGIYDLQLAAQLFEQEETSPATSRLAGESVLTTRQRNFNISADQLLPWGGVVSPSFNLFRQESNNRDVALNPLYASDLDFVYTQPLLRNLGQLATERGIRIARLNSDI